MSRIINLLLAGAALVTLVACSSAPVVQNEALKNPSDVPTQVVDPKVYPVGPFGYQVGDVIPNVAFVGRMDPKNKASSSVIRMSDFFQDKSVKVLALLIAAEWCGPCRQEQGELVDAFNAYKAANAGVAFLEALTESNNPARSPADIGTVDRWLGNPWTNFSTQKDGLIIPFAVVADPTYESVPLGLTAYPTRLIITTKDMVIQSTGQGYAPKSRDLEGAIDAALAL